MTNSTCAATAYLTLNAVMKLAGYAVLVATGFTR